MKIIKIEDCRSCPLSQKNLWNYQQNQYFCNHQATEEMEVSGYVFEVHPDCPLEDLKD
jgi:hypothetical protein